MMIDTYAKIMVSYYLFLFIATILLSIVYGIWKKTGEHLWLACCSLWYAVCGVFSLMSAILAYDDPASPNFELYENWTLTTFIFHDIKILFIWIGIGWLYYMIFCRGIFKRKGK